MFQRKPKNVISKKIKNILNTVDDPKTKSQPFETTSLPKGPRNKLQTPNIGVTNVPKVSVGPTPRNKLPTLKRSVPNNPRNKLQKPKYRCHKCSKSFRRTKKNYK